MSLCYVTVTMYRIMYRIVTAVSRYVSNRGKMYRCRPNYSSVETNDNTFLLNYSSIENIFIDLAESKFMMIFAFNTAYTRRHNFDKFSCYSEDEKETGAYRLDNNVL